MYYHIALSLQKEVKIFIMLVLFPSWPYLFCPYLVSQCCRDRDELLYSSISALSLNFKSLLVMKTFNPRYNIHLGVYPWPTASHFWFVNGEVSLICLNQMSSWMVIPNLLSSIWITMVLPWFCSHFSAQALNNLQCHQALAQATLLLFSLFVGIWQIDSLMLHKSEVICTWHYVNCFFIWFLNNHTCILFPELKGVIM